MDRLTTRDPDSKSVLLTKIERGELQLKLLKGTIEDLMHLQDAFERLAQYEDTGLTPEQIITAIELLKVHSIPIGDKDTGMIKVESSNIDSIGYDNTNNSLQVKFKNGSEYIYKAVPYELYLAFSISESKGRYLNRFITGQYEYEKIEQV